MMRRRQLAAGLCAAATLTACSSGGGSQVGTASTLGDPGRDAPVTTTETLEPTAAEEVPPGAGIYASVSEWICHPDLDDNPCIIEDGIRVVGADGTSGPIDLEPAGAPAFDCFYIYPTISGDAAPNSDRDYAEEVLVARNQAAAFSHVCDVYAPGYRQLTLGGLLGTEPATADDVALAYADVLDAWNHYVTVENAGRPVLLLGHSQGSLHLSNLLATAFDDARVPLVGAYLLGFATVLDESGAPLNFPEIPVCTSADQSGCVVSYASYLSDSPPGADSLFGRPDQLAPFPETLAAIERGLDLDLDTAGDVACVNPAAVSGGASAATAVFSQAAKPVFDAGSSAEPVDGEFIAYPGLVTTECTVSEGASYLAITVSDDGGPRSEEIPDSLPPAWGLHLIDVSLTQGDLIALAESQHASLQRGP